MKMYDQITEIFCNVDDFCLEFEKEIQTHLLTEGKPRKNRPFAMADSEVITIMTYFHLGSFRNFKHFYLYYVKTHLQSEFPTAVSYNRFVELMQKAKVKNTSDMVGVPVEVTTKNGALHSWRILEEVL